MILNKENIPDCFQNDIRNGEMRRKKVGPYNKKSFFFLQGMVLIHMTQYKSENLWLMKKKHSTFLSQKVYLPEVCPQRSFFSHVQAVEYKAVFARLTVQSSQS